MPIGKASRIIFCLIVLTTPGLLRAATYNGQTLDGQSLPATIFSEKKTKTYDVTVIFTGLDAQVTFHDNTTITLTMDSETIANPHHLRVFNEDKNSYWDLDLVGLN